MTLLRYPLIDLAQNGTFLVSKYVGEAMIKEGNGTFTFTGDAAHGREGFRRATAWACSIDTERGVQGASSS